MLHDCPLLFTDPKEIKYYYCNRTGFFTSVGQGQRHLKSQGTAKLNTHYTASLIITKQQSGIILVDIHVCTTHYGHTLSLGHV